MTEQLDFFVCKEECKDGSYKLHLCCAPSSSFIEVGNTVTIELPALVFLFAYDDELDRHYVLESAHDGKIRKCGLKVVEHGGVISFNEDADFALVPFGNIIHNHNGINEEETK